MIDPKPIKAKPQFYSAMLKPLQEIAREHGYNLVIHGSMNRDMDLIAIAWVDNPKPHLELLNAFCDYLNVTIRPSTETEYLHSILPGNRSSYVINLNRGGRWNGYNDEQYYLDISFTPQAAPIILCKECGNREVKKQGMICNRCEFDREQ